jgi:hypothetical protein
VVDAIEVDVELVGMALGPAELLATVGQDRNRFRTALPPSLR